MAKSITQQQKAEIRRLTRAANRRLERATSGQRKALQYWVSRMTGQYGATKFSSSYKGMSYEQAAQRIEKLNQFMNAKSTTRKGWDEIKADNVAKANKTLGKQGYDLTDEELADIFEQLHNADYTEKYRAINLVQAAKWKAETTGDASVWNGTSAEISKAIMEKVDADEALARALTARQSHKQATIGPEMPD